MKQRPSYDKLRGGYYTPPVVADFLSNWAIRSDRDTILEPSSGDGVFLEAACTRLLGLGARPSKMPELLTGYEIDAREARKARSRFLKRVREKAAATSVVTQDFFTGYLGLYARRSFDAVLGNPPFIRYQNFPETQRAIALKIMQSAGLHPNKLTNVWVPFVVASALLLKQGGRLGMVVPAELLQVTYAAELRLFLSEYFSRITVFTFRSLAFEGIQQEVVLLLGERGSHESCGIEVVELESVSQLTNYVSRGFGAAGLKPVDHTSEKWTQYFLSKEEIELVRDLRFDPRITKLGEIADTDIGIVTGMNDFFLLTREQARTEGLEDFTRALVSRSNQLDGIIFRWEDWLNNAREGRLVHLLDLPPEDGTRFPLKVREYIAGGEEKSIHTGYKCRIRKHWYAVPSVYVPPAFLLRQIHHFPKLIANEAGATSTDTIHRVRFRNGDAPRQIAAAFLNSLTFAFSELLGRSYGGGVLELEPSEADQLPIPLRRSERLNPERIDSVLRAGDIAAVLEQTDNVLLAGGLRLSEEEVATLRRIWNKLRIRRIQRRGGKAARANPHAGAGLDILSDRPSALSQRNPRSGSGTRPVAHPD